MLWMLWLSAICLPLAFASSSCPYGHYKREVPSNRPCPNNGSKTTKQCPLSFDDLAAIGSTLNVAAKKSEKLAAKAFIKYFDAKSGDGAKVEGRSDSKVTRQEQRLDEWRTKQAESCMAALHSYLKVGHLGQGKHCPIAAKILGKYDPSAVQTFGNVLAGLVAEELGDEFTTEDKEAWNNGIKLMNLVLSKTVE